MGAGRLVALLLWVLALSRLTDWGRGWWRSKHHTEFGTHVWGTWSLILDGDINLLTGEWWVDLACAWGTSGACVLGYPAGIHWFANCHMIRYDLAMI